MEEETQDTSIDKESLFEVLDEVVSSLEALQNEVLDLTEKVDSLPSEDLTPQIDKLKSDVETFAAKVDKPAQIIEKTTIIKGEPGKSVIGPPGASGRPGRDAPPIDTKPIIEEVRNALLPLIPQGGNLPGRRWAVNSSVVGAMFNDVNIVAAGATATNDITNKRTILTIPQGGGGGTPAAPDTSVQFNDGGSFGGDANFTWNKTAGLSVVAHDKSGIGGSNSLVAGNGLGAGDDGGNTNFSGGNDGDGAGTGATVLTKGSQFNDSGRAGPLVISSGSGNSGIIAGGPISMTAGQGGPVGGSGGNISIISGSAQGGDSIGGDFTQTAGNGFGNARGGAYIMRAGDAGTTGGDGGDYTIIAGSAQGGNGQGGGMELDSGAGEGSGNGGNFFLTAGGGGTTGVGGQFQIKGGLGGATTGAGGDLFLQAGNAQAGDSNGGGIIFNAGTKSGAGTDGQIMMPTLPTSDPAIPGALYVSAGTLKISL